MAPSAATVEARPLAFYEECKFDGETYIVSNNHDLLSLDFVTNAYKTENTYWTKEMDPAMIALMIQHSSVLGIYHHAQQEGHSPHDDSSHTQQPQQVGMARFITDHVTHAYLTDIYVSHSHRHKGLGTWLAECCRKIIEGMPFLRKAMLCTSDPVKNAGFYQERLGMYVPEQDPNAHLVMMRKGAGQVRHVPVRKEDHASESA